MSQTQITDIDEQLQLIISNKSFDQKTQNWSIIMEQIPPKILFIIQKTYNSDIQDIIKDPFDELHTQTVEGLTKKITEYITTSFKQSPPFTILRLAEVLISPTTYYSNTEKFLRAIENIIYVRSTISDSKDTDETNGNSIPTLASTENGSQTSTPTLVIGPDESQTILLSKIDWLTDEDLKEIESENYLLDEFPINDLGPAAFIGTHDDEDDDDDDEYPIDTESARKRKAGENQTDFDGAEEALSDSPEKRFKSDPKEIEEETETKQDNEAESKKDEAETKQQDNEVSTPTGKTNLEEAETPKTPKTEIEAEVTTEDTKNEAPIKQKEVGDVSDISIDEPSEADLSIGNTTLEEDKMDID